MSLKKTSEGKVVKKREKFITQKSFIQSQLFNSTLISDDNKSEADTSSRYKPLQLSKKGSTKTVRLYKEKQKPKKQFDQITIIHETDTEEGEGEKEDQILSSQMKTSMVDYFQPKVLVKDIINLCSDSDNNI